MYKRGREKELEEEREERGPNYLPRIIVFPFVPRKGFQSYINLNFVCLTVSSVLHETGEYS